MKLAVDTNVLVRYVTWDDDIQSPLAAQAIEAADRLIISTIVLCEMVWVLRRLYKCSESEIAGILRQLIKTAKVELDAAETAAGLACLEAGADFADGVVLYQSNRAKADYVITFDKNFAAAVNSPQVRLL